MLQHTTQLFETLLEKIERLEQRMDANEAEQSTPSNEPTQSPKTAVKKTKKATKCANTNNNNQTTVSACKTAIRKNKKRNSKAEKVAIKEQKPCANTVLEINTTAPNISEYFSENSVIEWVQTESNQSINYDNNQAKQVSHCSAKHQNNPSKNTPPDQHANAIPQNTSPDHSHCNTQNVAHDHYSERQAGTEIEDTNNHQNTEQKSNQNKDLHYPDVLGQENCTPLMNLIKRVPKHAQDILDLLALRMNNTRDPIKNMAQYCSTLVRAAQNGQLDTDALKASRAQRKIALDPKKKQWDDLQQEYRDALSEYEHFDRINNGQANYRNCTVEEYLEDSGMALNWDNILKRLENVKREIDALGYTPTTN